MHHVKRKIVNLDPERRPMKRQLRRLSITFIILKDKKIPVKKPWATFNHPPFLSTT
ncbi:hypothetical protein LguiB_027794 [Lonicera macranthoides]